MYFNPLNISNLKNTDLFNTVFNPEYLDIYVPIKETPKLTDEQKRKFDKLMQYTEKCFSSGNSVNIDLKTMINKNGNIKTQYKNGLLIMHNDEYYGGEFIVTQENFTGPVRIELRAMTDNTNIVLSYHCGFVIINWDDGGRETLFVRDITNGEIFSYKKCGNIPLNTLVDIEWTIGKEMMTLKINVNCGTPEIIIRTSKRLKKAICLPRL